MSEPRRPSTRSKKQEPGFQTPPSGGPLQEVEGASPRPKTKRPKTTQRKAEISVGPPFKLVFLITVGLTILSLVAAVLLTLYGPRNDETARLIETCSTTWKLGMGAILGLLGGKSLE